MKSSVFKFVFAPVCFVLVLVISQVVFKGARVDVTDQNIYSLTQGTHNIVSALEQNVTLNLYYSDKVSKDITALRSYAKRVEELLQEYVLLSDGKITLNIIDPEPFSEAEDKAAEAGLQAVPIATGDDIYFGLEASSENGNSQTITFFQPDREPFLEYEISELIYRLGQTQLPVVGLLTGLDMRGGFDMQSGGPTPPWVVFEQMDQLYDVRWVEDQPEQIDAEIELLIVAQPDALDEISLYAIEQFVLRGGKLLAFLDPKAESKQTDPLDDFTGINILGPLFEQWGVKYDPTQVVVDAQYGLTISMGQNQPPIRHLGLLGVQIDGMNPNEVVTSELETLNFAAAGFIEPTADATTQFDSLVWSSTVAQAISLNQYNLAKDPRQLMQGFEPTGDSYTLAARISGPANSHFEASLQPIEGAKPHIASSEQINVMIVADTDVLTDRLWVQVQNFFGQRIVQPWADNGAFVQNMAEQFLGSDDLITIRSRGRFTRPFEVVQDLRQAAQDKYYENEQALQQQLEDTEKRLADLEQQRDKDTLTLSPEQEATLSGFQQEKLRIRKALRDVRHELDKDIEGLGTWLKVLNIAIVPIILTLILLLLARITLRQGHKKA
ncbi:GldG family protein [Oceaniserpentilla sp. 4NH20-0058]|uniref:GldG family protein n=1 Tax=Oceaniserpentilla sp. 4NH20-0058 TaxID=3127660 RepID=UPI003106C6FD